jgi:hypothetical protein
VWARGPALKGASPAFLRLIARVRDSVSTMCIRVPIVALGMLLAASASYGKAQAIESPRELVEACQNLERATTGKEKHVRIPNTPPALLCWGYMQAVQDLSVLADESGNRLLGSCPPENTTSLQLIRSFLGYARAHPDALTGNTAVVVIHSLQEAFPCE